MRYTQKFLIILSLFIGFPQISYAHSNDALIILIINPKNVGEVSQIRGVARYMKADLAKVHIEEVESSDLSKTFALLAKHSSTKNLVIAAGAEGINILREIKSKSPGIFSVYLSHQIYDNSSALLMTEHSPNGANLIVLPKHVVTSKFESLAMVSKTKLMTIVGVAHNLHKSDIEKAYEKQVLSMPGTTADKYMLVIMGGDAQNPDGSWNYFTKKDASKLATIVQKSIDQDTYVFVLNGPRTGKHNPDTKEENQEAHRSAKLDPVTQIFVDHFKNREKFHVFDFQYGKAGMYRPLLGKMLHSANSKIFVPGESTSMISEIVDSVGSNEKHQIFAYEHSAMTKVHKAHISSEHAAGRINLVSKNGGMIQQITAKDAKENSVAKAIADDIIKALGV